jgi:hypothetical protein
MNDPNNTLFLSYEPQTPKPAGNRAIRTAGLVLLLLGAACFVCTIVGIALAFHAVRTSPSPTPAQLALGISRSLCFSILGIIFLFIGLFLRALSSRIRRNHRR